MKLNRSVLVAAMIIGSTVAVAGCNTADVEDEGAEQSSAQQGSEPGVTLASVASEAHRVGNGWGRERRAEGRGRWEHRREERRERREHLREERRERGHQGWWGRIRRWWR
jgi:hypothetical protein